MSQHSTSETRAEPVRGERGRFAPGGPSANPHGRPKRGMSLAERVRHRADPDELVDFLIGVVRNEKAKLEARLEAARQLFDRGWGKPLASHEISVAVPGPAAGRDLSALPVDERRDLLAKLRGLPALGDGAPAALPEPVAAGGDTA